MSFCCSIRHFLCYLTITLFWICINPVTAAQLTDSQQTYLDARKALAQGNINQFIQLRKQLDGYPLTPYLDFHANIDTILDYPGTKAFTAIEEFKDTPLYQSARYRYLINAGKKKRWQDFIKISPELPRNIVLQCFYYHAQLAQNNTQIAFKGAERLWLYGHSRPKECDPLFKAWEKSGHRTQELLWSRMLLAFNSNEFGLLRYLANKTTAHKTEAQRLLSVYKDPRSLRHSNKFMAKAPIYGDIVNAGLRRLAKKDLEQATALYLTYEKANRFSDYQAAKLSRFLIKRVLVRQESTLKTFVDQRLPSIDSDDLKELRLRWAIREQDNSTLDTLLPLLTEDKRAKARWQYWLSRSQTAQNNQQEILKKLAQQRNFYGFTAANQLMQDFELQHQDTAPDKALASTLTNDLGFARVVELLAIDKQIDARAEWVFLLNRHNNAMRAQYALLALQNQWHDLAVQASIQGQLWTDMDLRFPLAADNAFNKASKQAGVDIDEIRAIARRESAFYPYATSGVGARGLMQLMPATAKEIAKKSGIKYRNQKSLYDVEINTQLGSRYYASLLERFDNNRVLATAAYNAGPHRVTRWLKQSNGQLDVMAFIESIPFTETREYVQAVLSYRVIYQTRQNKPAQLFSQQELSFKY
ncbi:transglycosylase SLT domain-containing protein [Shewanella psychrotolerans]|uniref:transglycosylase SLT domain-containing protein n=1 Tax=Shewanella psychrotolerans TaxID=2864206 RepID=UPI001C65A229|nr:transglycosylase SLT domain-containing protein [Shewanella psychrotolerans]QYK03292.1 transglycosylase SLT domain-containing protein [Shewanella psychrotolerans]